jgi:hypothetical protein
VRGVKAVANDIEVRLPGSAERTDADIAAEAARMLEWDPQIPPHNLKVTVSDASRDLTIRSFIGRTALSIRTVGPDMRSRQRQKTATKAGSSRTRGRVARSRPPSWPRKRPGTANFADVPWAL